MPPEPKILNFEHLNEFSHQLGFSHWGQASLHNPISLPFYKTWIDQNKHGEMNYLVEHYPLKENPKLLNERLESCLVFAHPYFPHPAPMPEQIENPTNLRTALYAQGQDYHFWLKEKLKKIADQLSQEFPNEVFLCTTDSAPILERDLAYRAGLGWVGKNTCVIHPQRGSFFLIGEIATSLKLTENIELTHDFCGNCTRCIDICPTKAIEAPRVLNATKCISYLTIESRQVPPLELRSAIGDHFFGCDLCQTICPWNQRIFSKKIEISTKRHLETNEKNFLIEELKVVLESSGKQLQKKYFGTPMMRAGPFGLKRNALVVIGNQKLTELRHLAEKLTEDVKLGELAQWTLQQLDS